MWWGAEDSAIQCAVVFYRATFSANFYNLHSLENKCQLAFTRNFTEKASTLTKQSSTEQASTAAMVRCGLLQSKHWRLGARDPRRGPININKPTAPDPHHRGLAQCTKLPHSDTNTKIQIQIQVQIQININKLPICITEAWAQCAKSGLNALP